MRINQKDQREDATMKVQICRNCGVTSVPYFGFWLPCRADSLGSHRDTEPIKLNDAVVATNLRRAYEGVPGFDRVKFDRHASPEIKALLRQPS